MKKLLIFLCCCVSVALWASDASSEPEHGKIGDLHTEKVPYVVREKTLHKAGSRFMVDAVYPVHITTARRIKEIDSKTRQSS